MVTSSASLVRAAPLHDLTLLTVYWTQCKVFIEEMEINIAWGIALDWSLVRGISIQLMTGWPPTRSA